MNRLTCYLAALVVTMQIAAGSLEAQSTDAKAQFNLAPWPQSVQAGSGTMALTDKSRIVASGASLAPLATILSGEIRMITGVTLATASGAGRAGDIVLAIDGKLKPEAAYTVTVDDKAVVTGGAYLGTAHGTSLLLQAITHTAGGTSLPKFTVQDRPYAEYYGLMVDIARQNNSLEELKGVVNMARLYRLRFLQLHMTDDQAWTFPSKAFPKLGTTNWATRGGPVPKVYTVDQWKELVRYADEHGVTFVPEIETPGHSGAARRDAPEVFGPDVAVMNMTNPKMYEALDTIIGEVCEVFKSSPYIHIGCDECNIEPISRNENSGEFRKVHNIKDGTDLFAWHIAKMNEIVKKHGKRTIAWQDAPLTERVPKDVIVMVWHIDGDNGATPSYIQEGRPVIQVTWTPCVYQPVKDVYEWNAWKKDWPQGGLMLGAQMVLWELSGTSAVPFLRYKAAPRGERVWNPYAGLPYLHFAKRIEATDDLLDRLLTGISVQETGLTMTLNDWLQAGGKGDEGSGILPKFAFDDQSTVTLTSAIPGTVIKYTLDGKDPAVDSPVISTPLKVYRPGIDKITVKAQAFDAAGRPLGAVWSREYYFKPIAGSVAGEIKPGDRISEPVTITLTAKMKGTIRYTLDGNAPTAQSLAYTGPIKLEKSASVVAGLFIDDKLAGQLWRQSFNWVAVVQNLTTGKPVKASGVEPGYPAENAVDGIVELNRAWWAGPYPQWLQIDLGKVYKLDSAEVFPYWDGGRYYQYTVELSTDGTAWTKVVDMSTNTKPAKPEGDLHKFAPTPGRYVKVNMLKNSANVGVHLVEVRVFEAK